MDCPICFELMFLDTTKIYSTTCGHIFHQKCIMECLKMKNLCPKCRKPCHPATIFELFFQFDRNKLVDMASIDERFKQITSSFNTLVSLNTDVQTSTTNTLDEVSRSTKEQNRKNIEEIAHLRKQVKEIDEKFKLQEKLVKDLIQKVVSLSQSNAEVHLLGETLKKDVKVLYGKLEDSSDSED